MSQIHIFVLNHTAITDLGVNHVLSRCGTGSLAFFLFVGDVRWERQGGIREREERPETEAAAARQGRGGGGEDRAI